MNAVTMEPVIAHEKAHLARRDCIVDGGDAAVDHRGFILYVMGLEGLGTGNQAPCALEREGNRQPQGRNPPQKNGKVNDMSNLFLKILNMSIAAGWLILAVVLLRFLLKKAPRWITVLLWGMPSETLRCTCQ